MASSPFAILALLLLAACGPSAKDRESTRLLHAIDALRDAPSEPSSARLALLTDLEQLAVSYPDLSATKEACIAAYRLLLDGTALEARARKALDNPGMNPVLDLSAAETKIKQATEAMPKCDSQLAELRRRIRTNQ